MDSVFKKKILAALLLLACLLSGAWLITVDERDQPAVDPASADSILIRELESFNIPRDKYRSTRIEVTDEFYRKNYRIRLPAGVSKTWFHSELSRKLYDHEMATWANVHFPGKGMDIHILSNNKVIRSLHVTTDTTYQRLLHPAYILMYFNRLPREQEIRRIESLGEPVGIVLQVRSAGQASSWMENMPDTHLSLYFWMADDDYAHLSNDFDHGRFLERTARFASVSSEPGLLFFPPSNFYPGEEFYRQLTANNIRIIRTSDASIISYADGRFAFDQEFGNFARRARRGERPVALIRASPQSIEWFSANLTNLKKGGIVLARPPFAGMPDR